MSTQETIAHLSSRLADLTLQIVERQTELDRLTREHDALKMALNSLENLGEIRTANAEAGSDGLTYQQALVYSKIPIGRQNALPPAMIGKRCVGLEPDYVRKTLKRLADYGRIKTEQSRYWRQD
ncbi:hypothetical protein AAG596_10680 [Citromicrobium bathyomarinum]|uniref:hypothetical protein n=1 Tax=Citromicrobium bathyomarinum TaxID=72174 RepID=UPI00315ADF34